MVAPFPEPPNFLPVGSPSPALTAIVRALLPALLNQARFRASDLAPAVDGRDFSRFLIAPLRRVPRIEAPATVEARVPLERYAIACGLLGGLGGFLDERFRAHDFQLGRRNCQQFLSKRFAAAADNVVVGRPGGVGSEPAIPLLGAAANPIPLRRWPQMGVQDFEVLCRRMTARIDALAPPPTVGCTLRSLTHHLALLPSIANVTTHWHIADELGRESEHHAFNLLLVPFPYSVPTASVDATLQQDHHVRQTPVRTAVVLRHVHVAPRARGLRFDEVGLMVSVRANLQCRTFPPATATFWPARRGRSSETRARGARTWLARRSRLA